MIWKILLGYVLPLTIVVLALAWVIMLIIGLIQLIKVQGLII